MPTHIHLILQQLKDDGRFIKKSEPISDRNIFSARRLLYGGSLYAHPFAAPAVKRWGTPSQEGSATPAESF